MISCFCGASVLAPTLLDMTTLEPAPVVTVSESPPLTWGVAHRLRLAGIVLLLIAVVGGIGLYVERPRSRSDMIDPEQIRQTAEKLPPLRTWQIWETMQQGLDRRTDRKYLDDVDKFHFELGVVAVLALLGVGLIAAGAIGARGEAV